MIFYMTYEQLHILDIRIFARIELCHQKVVDDGHRDVGSNNSKNIVSTATTMQLIHEIIVGSI